MPKPKPKPDAKSGKGTITPTRSKPQTQTRAQIDPKSKISKPTTTTTASTRPISNTQKDPKQSHLYTDDNPSTTLHGTGFKDRETAIRTIDLVSRRSLTYQWQVINTMYHRAKGHPAMKKAEAGGGGESVGGMKGAMQIFRMWLDETYPEERERRKREGREFKPLVGKGVVQRYLERIQGLESDGKEDDGYDLKDCKQFAAMYAVLGKGKRLANTLVDEKHPEREDWEVRRERALVKLNEARVGKGEDGLWNEKGGVSDWHLRCVAWAWSPAGERRLPP